MAGEVNIIEELDKIKREIADVRSLTQQHHSSLMGDNTTVGLITRVRDLEHEQAESRSEIKADIAGMKVSLDKLTSALLGNLANGTGVGALARVAEHDKKIGDMFKLGWLLLGSIITLILAQVWQAVLAYQALTIINK